MRGAHTARSSSDDGYLAIDSSHDDLLCNSTYLALDKNQASPATCGVVIHLSSTEHSKSSSL